MSGCSCPGKPELLVGKPIGMYHCEYCGTMVIAGLPHPSDKAVEEVGDVPYKALTKRKKPIDIAQEHEPDDNINSYEEEEHCGDS